MTEVNHVKGTDKGKIFLYALSTCVWCRKTKKLLDSMGVEYSYIYMDKLDGEKRDKRMEELRKWNPRGSFPTLIFNDEKCIVGFKEVEIKKELE